MTTEYGRKVAGALRAVRQLHSDTSKLLVDFDSKRLRDGWTSVFGNTATSGQTAVVETSYWMAEMVFRYYVKPPLLDLAECAAVSFFHSKGKSEEPLLLVAQIKYQLPSGTAMKDFCRLWDIWYLFFDWNHDQNLEKVISIASADRGRIEWARVLAVPLYSITRVEDAEQLMTQVRGFSEVLP